MNTNLYGKPIEGSFWKDYTEAYKAELGRLVADGWAIYVRKNLPTPAYIYKVCPSNDYVYGYLAFAPGGNTFNEIYWREDDLRLLVDTAGNLVLPCGRQLSSIGEVNEKL